MPEASQTKSKAVATQGSPAQEAPLEEQLLAVAKSPSERALAFQLAGTERQQKMLRLTAMAVAETGWGKDVSPVARQAVVRYCLEIGADPVRHVHVLAGNVYLNAAFWMELVAANPKFRRPEEELIHQDERASAEENERRKARRVEFGVPEHAKGAAVVTLFYEGRGPFIGVNWAGARKNDPVGDAEPTKTALTRAYRRAAMKAEPAWFTKHPRLQAAHELLVQGRELEKNAESERPDTIPLTDGFSGEQVPAIAASAPISIDPYTETKHEPSAICPTVGTHATADCGYNKLPKK